MGIDTVKLVVPVEPACPPDLLPNVFRAEWVNPKTGEIVESASSRETLPEGVELVLARRNGTVGAQCEFSVPRVVHGHNVEPASLEQALDALSWAYDLIADRVPVATELGESLISRIDLDRDFLAPSMHGHLSALGDSRPPRGRSGAAYRDSENRVVALTRGTPGRWRVTAYDKAHELLEHRRPDGHVELARDRLRVEVSLRTPALRDAGLRTVSDLATTDTGLLTRKWVESAGITQPVYSAADLARRIAEGQARHGAKFESVIGSLLAEGVVGRSLRSANTRDDYRRRARELGLDRSVDLLTQRPETSRLDFDVGRLLWGAEASA